MLYPLELKLRPILNGSSSCDKACERLPERRPAHTKMMSPGDGYVPLEGPNEADAGFPEDKRLALSIHTCLLLQHAADGPTYTCWCLN